MKLKTALLAATLGLAAMPFTAQAQMRALSDPVVPHPDPESLFTSDDPLLHRNKQAALHIQRNLLKCNEWSRAGEWLTDAYIQHNPLAASGLEGVIYYFTQVAKRPPVDPCPALSPEDPNGVVAVQAEGDYVTILTRRIVPYADDPSQSYTTTWFDTWRFVDGKADEHWDPATLPTTAPPQAATLTPEAAAQQLADRSAIEELMWNYVRAIDTWDADAYAEVFTENGAFGQTKGREALHNMVTSMAAGRAERAAKGEAVPPLHHVMSNQTIDFTSPTRAVVNYYWQTVSRGSPGGPRPEMLAQGWGRDEVVKQGDTWLIENRNVAPDAETD